MKGLHTPEYRDEPIVLFEDLRRRGRPRHEAAPGRHAELLAAVEPDDASVVAFTAGTTGRAARRPALAARDRWRWAGCSPRASARGRTTAASRCSRSATRRRGRSTSSSRSSPARRSTSPSRRRRSSPTWRSCRRRSFVATPRFFARIRGTASSFRPPGRPRSSGVAYRFGMRQLGRALAARTARRQRASAPRSDSATLLVGRWVLDKAGLLTVRYAGVGGRAGSRRICSSGTGALACRFTSSTARSRRAAIAFAQRGLEDAGTAGTPLGAGIEARVGPDGELTLRTPGLLVGRLDERGRRLDDGWFATGDVVPRSTSRARAVRSTAAAAPHDDARRRRLLAARSPPRSSARRYIVDRSGGRARDGRS